MCRPSLLPDPSTNAISYAVCGDLGTLIVAVAFALLASATEHGARPPNDGAPTVNFPTVAAANITAIRDLSTARCGRPSESCAPPIRCRCTVDGPSVGRTGQASTAVAVLACRRRRVQAAGEGGSACSGMGGVRRARRAVADGRGMLGRSLGGALPQVPVWGAHSGR